MSFGLVVAPESPRHSPWFVRGAARLRNVWLRFEGIPAWQSSLLIFAASLAVRMALAIVLHTLNKPDRYEMERAALSLARYGILGNPYLIPTGPTAHVAPAYALLLAAIFRLFGDGVRGELVKKLCASAATSAQYALLPVVSPALGMTRRVGLIAGLAGALIPIKLATEMYGDWEAPFAALALLLLVYRIAVTWRDGRFPIRRGFLQGLGWGAALLCSPNLLPVFFAIMALGLWRVGRSRPRKYLGYAAANIVAIALCLTPWAIRNQRALGSPIFTRSNFGIELHMSNNDLASPLEPLNLQHRLYDMLHPLTNLKEAETVRDIGEVAYNRNKLNEALLWIRTHPRRFAELTAARIWYTWFPRTPVAKRDVVDWLVTIACALGLGLLWKRSPDSALLLSGCLLSYTAIYSIIQVMVRYRYPIDWIVLLTACYFMVSAFTFLGRRPAAKL
jgi:hypothetical protein